MLKLIFQSHTLTTFINIYLFKFFSSFALLNFWSAYDILIAPHNELLCIRASLIYMHVIILFLEVKCCL